MFTAIENFMPDPYPKFVNEQFFGLSFPWFVSPHTVIKAPDSYIDQHTKDSPIFYHSFFHDGAQNSPHMDLVLPLLLEFERKNKTTVTEIKNIRANMTYPDIFSSETDYKPIHVDTHDVGVTTAIYYVNDSDGETLFFEDLGPEGMRQISEVCPKKNTLIYFPATTRHSSRSPRRNHLRCVVNLNFIVGGGYESANRGN